MAIAIVTKLRARCRGGTPSWGRSPQTPLDEPIILSNLATAIHSYTQLRNRRLLNYVGCEKLWERGLENVFPNALLAKG